MATPLNVKNLVSFEELLMSQVVPQDALIRLLIENGGPPFTKEEFLEMVRVVDGDTPKGWALTLLESERGANSRGFGMRTVGRRVILTSR